MAHHCFHQPAFRFGRRRFAGSQSVTPVNSWKQIGNIFSNGGRGGHYDPKDLNTYFIHTKHFMEMLAGENSGGPLCPPPHALGRVK